MQRWIQAVIAFTLVGCAAGCAQLLQASNHPSRQKGSVVEYLYPDATTEPAVPAGGAALHAPVRVGIAFVPGGGWDAGVTAQEQLQLARTLRDAFAAVPDIAAIEIIPAGSMTARGGYDDLARVARLYGVDVVALLSYDQIQFNDMNSLAVGYWTLVGAYVLHGDQYDVQTLVDASVVHVSSRRLLFHAAGTDRRQGAASMAGFSDASRAARSRSFARAVDDLIPHLQEALARYREHAGSPAASSPVH